VIRIARSNNDYNQNSTNKYDDSNNKTMIIKKQKPQLKEMVINIIINETEVKMLLNSGSTRNYLSAD